MRNPAWYSATGRGSRALDKDLDKTQNLNKCPSSPPPYPLLHFITTLCTTSLLYIPKSYYNFCTEMAPPSAIDIRGLTDTEAVIYPDPLTINEVTERRAKAGKLVAGVAAGTSSDLFKGKVSFTYPPQIGRL